MFHYELYKVRQAEALSEAAAYRLARQARRAGGSRSTADEPGRQVRTVNRREGGRRSSRTYGTVA
jgi:hypothetical protein